MKITFIIKMAYLLIGICLLNAPAFALARTAYFASTSQFYECNLSVYNFGTTAQRISDLSIPNQPEFDYSGTSDWVASMAKCAESAGFNPLQNCICFYDGNSCIGNTWLQKNGVGNSTSYLALYHQTVLEPGDVFTVTFSTPLLQFYNPGVYDRLLNGYITVDDIVCSNKNSEQGSVNLQMNCLRHGYDGWGTSTPTPGINATNSLDKGMFSIDINGGLPL